MRQQRGFTIMEILIAVSILAILMAVVGIRVSDVSKRSRDAERQADLRTLQSAIELYKNKYGRYPAGCRGASTWSGQIGTAYACPGGSAEYIVDLAPEFIPALPKDPKLKAVTANCATATGGAPSTGYVYTTNADGTVYKLMAKCTVESETIIEGHVFQSCEANPGICTRTDPSNSTPSWCDPSAATFQTSYAVWGGMKINSGAVTAEQKERFTEDIVCDIQ